MVRYDVLTPGGSSPKLPEPTIVIITMLMLLSAFTGLRRRELTSPLREVARLILRVKAKGKALVREFPSFLLDPLQLECFVAPMGGWSMGNTA